MHGSVLLGSAICVSINSVAFVGYVMNLCLCFEFSVSSLGRYLKGRGEKGTLDAQERGGCEGTEKRGSHMPNPPSPPSAHFLF